MKKYDVIVSTGYNKTWPGRGGTVEGAIEDAFRKIVVACHNEAKLKIETTYSFRFAGEPKSKNISGFSTLKMLEKVGELDDLQAWMLEEELKRG